MEQEPTQNEELESGVETANDTEAFSSDEVRTTGSVANAEPTSLTSDDLDSVDDINVVQPEPETAAVGLEAQIGEQLAADDKKRAEEAAQAQAQKEAALEDVTSFLANTPGETELTATAEEAAGVPEIRKELDAINDEIRQEQQALRRRIERVQTQAGLTKGQVNQRVQEMERVSLRKQADLSIVSMGIQQRFNSARSIAEQKIQIALERDQKQFQALTLTFQENKDLFTKAEERAFNASQKRMQNEIESKRKILEDVNEVSINALKNGAPPTIAMSMMNAENIVEALKVGGQYINAYDKRIKELQIKNIKSQIADRASQIADREREREDPTAKPLTASQAQALGFGERLLESSLVIDEVGSDFTGTASKFAGLLPNTLKSADRQRFDQAQRNFINAVLRRESGAAISPDEFDNARLQYFPQPGDKQEVLIQKKRNRDMVISALLREGGVDTSPQEASLNDPLELGITPTDINPLGI